MVKVSVIGCGVLGAKIAGELAYHGHEVRVYDQSQEALSKVQARLNEDKKMLREDGLLSQPNFVGEVYAMTRLEDAVRESDLIFECAPEDISIKQDLFKQISQCCRQDAVISTTTLRLSVDAVTEKATHQSRCLGVRFLYPVYCIPEVEVVPCQNTSLLTLEKVRLFLERMGKVAFFRSGLEPLILTEDQRESRRMAYIQRMKQSKGLNGLLQRNVPDLASYETVTNALHEEMNGGAAAREKDCVICMDEERNCVLHPCHHLCTCVACGRMLLKRQDACPICRRNITNIFRIYLS